MDKNTKVAFGIKGFCESCGVYKRPGLTTANYVDLFGRQHRKALLCADCYSDAVDYYDADSDPDITESESKDADE